MIPIFQVEKPETLEGQKAKQCHIDHKSQGLTMSYSFKLYKFSKNKKNKLYKFSSKHLSPKMLNAPHYYEAFDDVYS